jgi:hypothetical protein
MPLILARLIVAGAAAYAALGAAFAAAFVTRGVSRIDPGAKGSQWGFRLLIVPGVVALWPYLLGRWASGALAPPDERNAHRRAARDDS